MHLFHFPNPFRWVLGKIPFLTALALIALLLSGLSARIAIYGDTRGDDATHALVVIAISTFAPDLVFHTGDLSSKGKSAAEYDNFKAIIKDLGKTEFYPVRGNHERDEQLFLSSFPQLQSSTRYLLERDSLVFIALDSTLELKPGSDQLNWLREQLAKHHDQAVILLLHHPVFSSGAHGDELGLGVWLPTLLEGSSVIAVISGHEHSYERSAYQGIYYLVSGGGGSPFREKRNPNPHSKVFVISHHFIVMDRQGPILEVRVLKPDLTELDSFEIKL